jgi:hypothetical protein
MWKRSYIMHTQERNTSTLVVTSFHRDAYTRDNYIYSSVIELTKIDMHALFDYIDIFRVYGKYLAPQGPPFWPHPIHLKDDCRCRCQHFWPPPPLEYIRAFPAEGRSSTAAEGWSRTVLNHPIRVECMAHTPVEFAQIRLHVHEQCHFMHQRILYQWLYQKKALQLSKTSIWC